MVCYTQKYLLILLSLVLLPFANLWASSESYIQTLSGKIKKGDSCTVVDDKFVNLPLAEWNQVKYLSVDNMITFELRRDTSLFYQSRPFTCNLRLTIRYFTSRDESTPHELKNIELKVRFDTASGKFYPVTNSYSFKNAFKVTVVVDSISSPEWGDKLPPVFRITNQIFVERKYPFDANKVGMAPAGLSPLGLPSAGFSPFGLVAGGPAPEMATMDDVPPPPPPGPNANGQWTISWQPITGVDQYDVEWTFIDYQDPRGMVIAANSTWFDGTQLLAVPTATEDSWMRHDATRVTVSGTVYSYAIDLPYVNGFVLARYRGVSYNTTTQLRTTTAWQYTDYTNSNRTLGIYLGTGHQQGLNWQYDANFAEEGKRKELITYFDATLRARQNVTIVNNDLDHTSVRNTAVVSETIYDNMGRPTMKILPAPLLSNALTYYSGVNRNGAGQPYSRDDIGSVGTNADGSCNITATPMSASSGAGQYYSSSNAFLADPTNYFFAKYIPDAGGKPFSLTEYTTDNTGRVRRQGGVGPTLQIGAGHDTRYFYGKPGGARDLERIFGMESGDATHYEKNLVVDPNGQISVSYVNSNGKTVATALASSTPPNLDALPSSALSTARTNFTQTLIQPTDFTADAGGLYKSSSTTFTAAFLGNYTLTYNLSPALAVPSTPSASGNFCSNCYYDITVDVLDNCGNPVAHDYPATPPFPGSDITCHGTPTAYTGTLTVPIQNVGEYTVVYKLKLSEAQIQYQTDYYVANNSTLQTIQNFFENLLPTIDLSGCYNECSTCIAKLGTLSDFTAKMQALLLQQKAEKYPNAPASNFNPNSSVITSWISSTYQSLYNNCVAIQTNCSAGSACEQKKQMLKDDVLPGGQYALFDQPSLDANAGQVFTDRGINVPLLHYAAMPAYFTADNGTSIHTVNDAGQLASSLSEADFIRAYQLHPEWADWFVQFHVEYCSYLWCKDASNPTPSTNMEVSYNFDQNIRQVYTSGDLATAQGYYNHSNPLALLQQDPFFKSTGRGYTYLGQMTADLQSYTDRSNIIMKDASGNILAGKDIISYVDWILYCAPPSVSATPADYINSWNSCSPAAGCRSTTREWALYSQYYMALKSKYVTLAKQTYNPSCRSCFVGNDGLNTLGPATCVTMVGSSSNPAFTFDGLNSNSPNVGGASLPDLMAAAWTCQAIHFPTCNFRTLFKWDLTSQIPAGATIASATLNLYANTQSVNGQPGLPDYGNANACWLSRVTSPWAAATTGWNNPPSVSTTDRKTLPQSSSQTQNYSVDVTSFVSQWLASPSTNYGMLLQLQNETYYNSLIFGGPSGPSGLYPTLQICYTTSAGSNSPTVNSPILATLQGCDASIGNAPPCPAATEFSTAYLNNKAVGDIASGTGFYDRTADVYLVHSGGAVTRDVTLNYQQATRTCSSCTWSTTPLTVTLYRGQTQVYLGQYHQHYSQTSGVVTSYAETDFPYSNSLSCLPYLAPPPSSCITDPNYAAYQNKMRVFNDYVDQTCLNQVGAPYATDNSSSGYSTASLTAMRQAASTQLAGLQQGWLGLFQGVRDEVFPGNPTLSDANLNILVTKLGNVCQAYINQAGESDIRAVSTLPVVNGTQLLSSDGYKDFHSVFVALVGTSLMAQGFSEDLLNNPYPYDKKNFDTDPLIGETTTDICSNVSNFKTAWTNSGSSLTFGQYLSSILGNDYLLTDAQLSDLQTKCTAGCVHGYLNNGIAVPVAFAASTTTHAPLTCTIVNQLVSNFATLYPTVTLAANPKLYKKLFANYANHAYGYSLSYYEYADFISSCALNTSIVLYDKPAQPQAVPDNFSCTAGIMANLFSQAGAEYDRYLALIRRQFRDSYISNCLANQAGASITGQNWEYHYTLYYYNQAGNLVKTIPPEGVQMLTSDQLDLMESLSATSGTASASSCPVYPSTMLTYKPSILSGFSTDLQNGTVHGVELWLYSAAGLTTRNVRFVTPDNKYMFQAAVSNNKLWVELYTLTPAGTNAYTITLVNQAVGDLTGQLPLQTWTHLFIVPGASITTQSPMSLYLDGVLIPGSGAATYPFPWTLNASTGLPVEDVAVLKHLRVYNAPAGSTDVVANYKNSCMWPAGTLNGASLILWGRFNVPGFCSNPTNAAPVSVPDRGALSVIANVNPQAPYMLTTVSNTFTQEFWVNPTSAENFYSGEATDPYAGIVQHNYVITPSWGGAAATGMAGMGVAVGTNGVAIFEHADNYMPAKLLWQGTISGWTHIAIVYNNKTPSLYVNGNLVATGTTSTKTYVYPCYNIGGNGYGWATCSIDELRIWAGVRSQAQIAASYNKTVLPANAGGLLGYWPIDNSVPGVIKDITCNAQDITFNATNYAFISSTPTVPEVTYMEFAKRFIVPNHALPSTYVYNSANQVIQQTTPDGGTSNFYYDRLGRMAASQNAEQVSPANGTDPANRYSYILYDALNRTTEVGEKINIPAGSPGMGEDLARNAGPSSQSGTLANWLTLGSNRQVIVTSYDAKPSWSPANLVQANLRKRVAAVARLSLVSNPAQPTDPSVNRTAATYYNYDMDGNVTTVVQENKSLIGNETQLVHGTDGLTGYKTIQYDYDLISGKVNKVMYQPGKWDQFNYQYVYDGENRVIRAITRREGSDGDPLGNLWTPEAAYTYYPHGSLARTQLGNLVQGIDYAYTLQGWLKGVNGSYLNAATDMSKDGQAAGVGSFGNFNRDVFGFSLDYFQGDYTPVGAALAQPANAFGLSYSPPAIGSAAPGGKDLFNGNIGSATYAMSKLESGNTIGYSYKYDQLNRLTAMNRHNITQGGSSWSNSTIVSDYAETVSYDGNGNIGHYTRNGTSSIGLSMDNLSYNYNVDASGHLVNNRLRSVSDGVTNSSASYNDIKNGQSIDNYTYDRIGNLVGDATSGNPMQITWNVQGKIATITKPGVSTISYDYDASGNRITKSVQDQTGAKTTTYYVRDATGNVLGVYTYKFSASSSVPTEGDWVEQDIYGSERVGTVNPNVRILSSAPLAADSYTANSTLGPLAGILGLRTYNLTNHLGNVLATISDKQVAIANGSVTDHYEADVQTMQDYYPFGMLMPGRSYIAGSSLSYRYGFNGKEKDDEVKGAGNWQDYGMRMYDPRIGRFPSVDPLKKKYPYYSPYQFSGDNPIKYIDLDGLEPANNPVTPGTQEKVAMATVNAIETGAAQNDAKTNLFSSGTYRASDQDIKGTYSCGKCEGYSTDTRRESADRFNMYVNNGATLNVDESQAAHFDNYEAFIVHRLTTNFVTGQGAENYNFPTNGIISSKFLQSDILKAALRDFNNGNKVEATQYSFGAAELGKDLLRTSTFFSITGFVGSGTITIVPTKDAVLIKIFNVTSLTSGDLLKNPSNDANWPRSYVRDPSKTTPYGNISETFNLSIPWDSPLLSRQPADQGAYEQAASNIWQNIPVSH